MTGERERGSRRERKEEREMKMKTKLRTELDFNNYVSFTVDKEREGEGRRKQYPS